MDLAVAGRRGIEFNPSFVRNVGLDPGVRVTGADNVLRGDVIELTTRESIHHPRRNSHRSQHDGHGRSEIFAMPLAAHEQKVGNGIAWCSAWKLERVSVVRPE